MSAAFTPKLLASTLWHVSVSFWLRLCNSLSVVLPAISFCHPHWYTSQPHISRSQHTSSFSPSVLSMRCVTFPHQREPCHSFPWLCDPISLQQWTLLGSLHLNYKSNTQPSCKYLCLSDNGNSRLYPAFVISQNRKPATQSVLLYQSLTYTDQPWSSSGSAQGLTLCWWFCCSFIQQTFPECLAYQALFKKLFTVNQTQSLLARNLWSNPVRWGLGGQTDFQKICLH